MKIIHNKLVRDYIPEIIRSDGKNLKTKTLPKENYIVGLEKVFVESATQLPKAKENKERIGEIVDLLEVLDAILNFYNIDRKEINLQKILKKKKKGSFSKRIYLEYEE